MALPKDKALHPVQCPKCPARPQKKDLADHMEAAHGVVQGGQNRGSQGARPGTKKHRNQQRHNRGERNHATGRRNGSR